MWTEIKLPGRKPFLEQTFLDDTIGSLTHRICDRFEITEENWGMYLGGTERVFLDANIKMYELDSTKTLYFLPRTMVR
jgi:hypothetical protein